jgi:hypothetical protein
LHSPNGKIKTASAKRAAVIATDVHATLWRRRDVEFIPFRPN